MKLIAKYNRVNIAATITVLLLTSICYYFILHYVLVDQLDDDLKVEEQEIVDYVKKNNSLPNPSSYKDQQVIFTAWNGSLGDKRRFTSKDGFDSSENEQIEVRQLEFKIAVGKENFTAFIIKSQEATEDLVKMMLLITTAVVILLLLFIFLINRLLFTKIWQPFHNTLAQLKQFNISSINTIKLDASSIDEFTELNDAVNTMTGRAIHDYHLLKNFTENASHEIQTPLAIIKSKLELLSQSEHLHEEQVRIILAAEQATNRLSKLSQSLLLLTKIENRQYHETEKIAIVTLFINSLYSYEELIIAKRITVKKDFDGSVTIEMNENLAEILVSNLVVNAIKYNIEGGEISIVATPSGFSVSNTGNPLQTSSPEDLFGRFKKDNPASESLGLGLAIVKKICERYGYQVSYNYTGNVHTIRIVFNT